MDAKGVKEKKTCKFMDDMTRFNNWLTTEFPPNIGKIPLNWSLNFSKGCVMIFMLGLMVYYDNFTLNAWMYTSIHGAYGFLWWMKD